jgi:DNA mismatch endonuclease (patch repair protein)
MDTLRKSGDIFSRKKRSEIMSGIKSKNTNLEKEVFRELKEIGLRFKTHYDVLGRPDIAIPSLKKAVFIDSDFWHGWRYPSWSFSTNKEFWNKKILANKARGVLVTRKLRRLGWNVLRVWEHQLKKDRRGTMAKIEKFLDRI